MVSIENSKAHSLQEIQDKLGMVRNVILGVGRVSSLPSRLDSLANFIAGGERIKQGFEDFGNKVKQGFEDFGNKLRQFFHIG
jgi:hypothetical protein